MRRSDQILTELTWLAVSFALAVTCDLYLLYCKQMFLFYTFCKQVCEGKFPHT